MPSSFLSRSARKGPTPFKYSMGFCRKPIATMLDYLNSTVITSLSDTKLTENKIKLFLVCDFSSNLAQVLQTSSYFQGH